MQHQSSAAQRSESPVASAPVVVTLPDGKRLEFGGPVTGADIAAAVGPGLAKAAIAAFARPGPIAAAMSAPVTGRANSRRLPSGKVTPRGA